MNEHLLCQAENERPFIIDRELRTGDDLGTEDWRLRLMTDDRDWGLATGDWRP